MKKFITVLLVISAITFTSCSSDSQSFADEAEASVSNESRWVKVFNGKLNAGTYRLRNTNGDIHRLKFNSTGSVQPQGIPGGHRYVRYRAATNRANKVKSVYIRNFGTFPAYNLRQGRWVRK